MTKTDASLENAIRALQTAFKTIADEADFDIATNEFRKPTATTHRLSASLHDAWEHVATALGLTASNERPDLAITRLVELERMAD